MECVFELRFADAQAGMIELLPGLVFGKLRGHFTRVTPLPLGQIPRLVRDQNPTLRYAPTAALEGSSVRMMFSNHSVAVSYVKPYAGWIKVKQSILECLNVVLETKLTGRIERYALKYVNLLKEGSDEFDLDQTQVQIRLGNFLLRSGGSSSLHAEIELNECINIVDIATGGRVTVPGSPEEVGVVISVDTVRNSPQSGVGTDLPQLLETLHETEKEIFFGLLKPETLKKLGPRYPATH